MSGGYRRPDGDGLGPLIQAIEDLKRRLSTLEIPTGTSVNSLVQQVQLAIANIGTSINAWLVANSYTKAQIDSLVASPGAISPTSVSASGSVGVGGDINLTGDLYTPHGRATPVVTSYVAAYINSDGRLGATPSSRRFKQQISAWSFDKQAVFALELFEYKYNLAVDELGDDAPTEIGLMAEDLDALGLTWLVVYDEDGAPWAVAYERLALALVPVIQDHERRLAALEAQSQ